MKAVACICAMTAIAVTACAAEPPAAPAAQYEKPDAALMARPAPLKDLPRGAGLAQVTLEYTQCRGQYDDVGDRLTLLQNYASRLVGVKPYTRKAPTS